MTQNDDLLDRYEKAIRPLLADAQRAYGSRDTQSPQHDASREYTRLLKEFYAAEGSLLKLAARLGVAYAGLNRRVKTADTPASSGRPRKKFPQEVYDAAIEEILAAKAEGTPQYHECLAKHYDAGLSLTRIAREMGLSSAMPLYYGVNKMKGKK